MDEREINNFFQTTGIQLDIQVWDSRVVVRNRYVDSGIIPLKVISKA